MGYLNLHQLGFAAIGEGLALLKKVVGAEVTLSSGSAMPPQPSQSGRQEPQWSWAKEVLLFVFCVLLLLLSINLMGTTILQFSQESVQRVMSATENPFVCLFIGLLVTAIIQSSSTTTALVIALVANGVMSIETAVPIVMGANVGTTITPTIVSLSYIARRNEFRKGLAAGAVHSLFNIFVVILLFPLESYYGLLTSLSRYVTKALFSGGTGEVVYAWQSIESFLFQPVSDYIIQLVDFQVFVLIISGILLFTSIKLLSKLFYRRVIGESRNRLQAVAFSSPLKSFVVGLIATAGVQSSSVTTSLMVPLVATNRVSLKKAWPFIMGANIGTTITAFIAALFKSEAALSLAFVHLFFNLTGVLFFLPISGLRNLPVRLANKLGIYTFNHRLIGLLYILMIFFVIPFVLISLSS